ncbi:MAG: GAF domain-containing protein, partial [Deltaproteobacteria bacterium]
MPRGARATSSAYCVRKPRPKRGDFIAVDAEARVRTRLRGTSLVVLLLELLRFRRGRPRTARGLTCGLRGQLVHLHAAALALVALDALPAVRAIAGLGVRGARLRECHRPHQPDHGAGDDRPKRRDLHLHFPPTGVGTRPPGCAAWMRDGPIWNASASVRTRFPHGAAIAIAISVPPPPRAEGRRMARCLAMESSHAIEKWNAELAFRPVVEATADKAGLDFMRHLVKNLALSLHVEHAFVAEFAGDEKHVKTIAYWSGGDWRPNVEFPLAGTPCERVVAGERCLYRDDVQKLFPADTDLVTLGVRSYLGVPLRGPDGRTLGHLAALDTRPMDDDPRGAAMFQVFANRARVEMERLHADLLMSRAFSDLEVRLADTRQHLADAQYNLDLAYHELQALLEINLSSTRHLRRPDLFYELARCVKPILPCERFGIEVPTGPESLRDQPSRGPMIEEFPSAGTACRWAQENRRRYVADSREDLRGAFPMTHLVMEREGMESLCALPLLRENRSFGALFFMSIQRGAYREIPNLLI